MTCNRLTMRRVSGSKRLNTIISYLRPISYSSIIDFDHLAASQKKVHYYNLPQAQII